jgi:hypothetical protein
MTTTTTTTTALESNIVNALIGMLYQPEERRLTQSELNERVETTRFGDITNPMNNVCSITHDVFEPTQRVSRIRHCGHIFNADSLSRWLRMNHTCPTCRHDLLTSPSATNASSSATNASSSATNASSSATTNATNATNATNTSTTNATNTSTTNASATNTSETNANATNAPRFRRLLDIPLESEIDINAFYNELLRNSQNIPGFELNSVNDDSIVFSFDMMNNRANRSGLNSEPGSGSGSGSGSGPRNIDDVD